MFAAIFLPHFRLQAALRFREALWAQPIAIVDEQSGAGLVLEATPPAIAAGVNAGLTSSQAMARCPALRLLPRAFEQEKNASAALMEIAESLSPDFEATAPGISIVDLRTRSADAPSADVARTPSSEHSSDEASAGQMRTRASALRDWSRWGGASVERLAALHLRARIGVAANADLALLAARRAEPVLVVQNAATFLADIAIAEVDPPPQLLAVLCDWGIGHLGQLAQVPRAALIDRLGPAAGELWQRAMGGQPRLLRLVRPVEEFVESFEFEHEIETAEPLLFVLRRMLEQISLRLAGAWRVAARMTLTLLLEMHDCHERAFTIPAPTADIEVLFRILHTHLDGLTLEQRPTGVRLVIEPVRAEHRQLRLFESLLRDANRFGETLARLVALVGPERVGVPELEDTHRPDRHRVVEPRFHTTAREEKCDAPELAIGLPLRRYRPAFPAQVHLVRHVPAFVFSEKIHGEIREAAGPYRLSGQWWEREQWSAEEWDIEMPDGGLFRLSKQGDSWFVEGDYDVAAV